MTTFDAPNTLTNAPNHSTQRIRILAYRASYLVAWSIRSVGCWVALRCSKVQTESTLVTRTPYGVHVSPPPLTAIQLLIAICIAICIRCPSMVRTRRHWLLSKPDRYSTTNGSCPKLIYAHNSGDLQCNTWMAIMFMSIHQGNSTPIAKNILF